MSSFMKLCMHACLKGHIYTCSVDGGGGDALKFIEMFYIDAVA